MAAIPVTNVTELQAMDYGWLGPADYYLANDIDASITKTWNAGAGFAIIFVGNTNSRFDGRGHTIKNLYMKRTDSWGVALFDWSPAILKDVVIENVYIENTGSDGHTGGLVGDASYWATTISGCFVSGTVKSSCGAYAICTGGLCGSNSGIITKSCSTADVIGGNLSDNIGGLVGYNSGSITNCFAKGNVSVVSSYMAQRGGGLVGWGTSGEIDKCYSIGTVVLPLSAYAHGFVGLNEATITSSYWDTETSEHTQGAYPDTDPPTGRTTAQMKQEATYIGWDFKRTWKIMEGVGYPMLRIGKTKKRTARSA